MANSPRCWKDKVWAVWFCIQPLVILLVDAVGNYPSWLVSQGAPLHFLQRFRDWHLATYNDRILSWTPENSGGNNSWIGLCLAIELGVSLPVVLWGVRRFVASSLGTTGAEELLFLVYAFETAFTTLICINDISYWDPAVYSPAMKNNFLYQYGPWFVIPSLLFVDMCSRIMARIRVADVAAQAKKTQ